MALVCGLRPNLLSVYRYCSSHHAGDTRSVTESGFFGLVRKRSRGGRLSLFAASDAVRIVLGREVLDFADG